MPEAAGVVLKLTPADMQTERQQSAAGRCAGFHGARAGAPKGKANGAWRHGSLHGRRSDAPAAMCGLTAECSQDNWQVMALPLSEPQRQGALRGAVGSGRRPKFRRAS